MTSASNIHINYLNNSTAFPTITQFLQRIKSYPAFPDGFSLEGGENQEYPVQYIIARGIRCDRLYIELTVQYPCPEFRELYTALDKKHLNWLIHHIIVYDFADEPHYYYNLDEFIHKVFPFLWRRSSLSALPQPNFINTSLPDSSVEEVPWNHDMLPSPNFITSYSLPSPSPTNSPLALPP